jgi:hypothetical protein
VYRSESAALAFFNKALKTHQPRRHRKVNLDGNAASHRALRLLRQENPEWRSVVMRSNRYLNNIVEQDHRAIKRRCAPMLAHRIRKRQFSFGRGGPRRFSSLKSLWARALTEGEIKAIKPLRYSRKVSDGGGLYLLVTPKGGRWWRYAYRFAQKHKALALGTYPAVPLERDRTRHEFARNLLAHGLDPLLQSRVKALIHDRVKRTSGPSCRD